MAACDESPTTSPAARRPASPSDAVDVVIRGPIAHDDLPGLCQRVRGVLEGSGAQEVVVCDVGTLNEPDLATVDALAWLALTARRLGGQLRLRHASGELRELLALVGLDGVVGS